MLIAMTLALHSGFIAPKAIARTGSTCRALRATSLDDTIWRRLCRQWAASDAPQLMQPQAQEAIELKPRDMFQWQLYRCRSIALLDCKSVYNADYVCTVEAVSFTLPHALDVHFTVRGNHSLGRLQAPNGSLLYVKTAATVSHAPEGKWYEALSCSVNKDSNPRSRISGTVTYDARLLACECVLHFQYGAGQYGGYRPAQMLHVTARLLRAIRVDHFPHMEAVIAAEHPVALPPL